MIKAKRFLTSETESQFIDRAKQNGIVFDRIAPKGFNGYRIEYLNGHSSLIDFAKAANVHNEYMVRVLVSNKSLMESNT